MIKKEYIIFAGVNGAGKSSFYKLNKNIFSMKRINSDEILNKFGGNWKNENDQIKAGFITVKKIKKYIENGISFNQETTLSGQSIFQLIKLAKRNNFKITLYYVGLENPQIAKERIKIRIKKGGHGIDDIVVENRYYKSLNNLKKVISLCDEVFIYDNTYSFKKIITIENNKILANKKINKFEWFKNLNIYN
jgi:predicted ABC-type ATPase